MPHAAPRFTFNSPASRFIGPRGFVSADSLGGSLQAVERAVLVSAQQAVHSAPDLAINLIRDQLREGINSRGQQMAPYSPRYATKRKGGRLRPRTLTDTGSMVGAMVGEERGPTEAAVVFISAEQEELARHHHFGTSRGLPATHWFGLAPKSQERLARQMDSIIRRSLPERAPTIRKEVRFVI